MRAAGRVVAEMHEAIRVAARPGVTTLHLDQVARDVLASRNATSNFLGYHGFPAVICASVNDEVVHGIPNERPLRDGDIVSIDCGAIVNGWHGDAAFTMAVGAIDADAQRLIDAADRGIGRGGRGDAARWTSRRRRCRGRVGGQRRRLRQPARLLRPRDRPGDARGSRCREPRPARQGPAAGARRRAGDRADADRRWSATT